MRGEREMELCGPHVPQVLALGLPNVLRGLEEKEAPWAGLVPVHQGARLAELPGPFQLGHSKTP